MLSPFNSLTLSSLLAKHASTRSWAIAIAEASAIPPMHMHRANFLLNYSYVGEKIITIAIEAGT